MVYVLLSVLFWLSVTLMAWSPPVDLGTGNDLEKLPESSVLSVPRLGIGLLSQVTFRGLAGANPLPLRVMFPPMLPFSAASDTTGVTLKLTLGGLVATVVLPVSLISWEPAAKAGTGNIDI